MRQRVASILAIWELPATAIVLFIIIIHFTQWAFGVTCWEIFTLGQQPYPSISSYEIADYIKDGGVLDKPFLCSDQM